MFAVQCCPLCEHASFTTTKSHLSTLGSPEKRSHVQKQRSNYSSPPPRAERSAERNHPWFHLLRERHLLVVEYISRFVHFFLKCPFADQTFEELWCGVFQDGRESGTSGYVMHRCSLETARINQPSIQSASHLRHNDHYELYGLLGASGVHHHRRYIVRVYRRVLVPLRLRTRGVQSDRRKKEAIEQSRHPLLHSLEQSLKELCCQNVLVLIKF